MGGAVPLFSSFLGCDNRHEDNKETFTSKMCIRDILLRAMARFCGSPRYIYCSAFHCLPVSQERHGPIYESRIFLMVKMDFLRYHYSRNRATIIWSLWRHQQSIGTSSAERTPSERYTGTMCKDRLFIVIYGFVTPRKKWNNVCILVTNSFCADSSVILVWISKTSLSWAPKQFVIQVHASFSMYILEIADT